MPRLGRRTGRRLSLEQETHLVLGDLIPGCELRATFGDLESARQAWERHGDRLMTEYYDPCRRPCAWWWWQAGAWEGRFPASGSWGGPRPVPEHQEDVLEALDELSEAEEVELSRWRANRNPPTQIHVLEESE